jgi:pyrophosphatase PpaX
MRELEAARDGTLLVGDSGIDVRTARAAGVAVVGVAWGLDPESLRAFPPDRILASLLELGELC